MLVIVVWIIELLSLYFCLHTLYAKAMQVNMKLVITFVAMIAILAIVNFTNIPNILSLFSYIILVIFCHIQFKESLFRSLISVFLDIIIIAIIQFVSMLLLSFVSFDNLDIRDLCGCIFLFLLVKFILPLCRLEKLREAIFRRHWLVYLIYFFISTVIVVALFLLKKQNIINLGLFIFGIPSITIILFLIIYWDKSLTAEKQMQKEINAMLQMQKNYDELIKTVKINQHGMKNQLLAMTSVQQKIMYDKPFSEDRESYYDVLQTESRYNSLVFAGNQTLVGFLYGKIKEIERKNISFSYKIKASFEGCQIPMYYIIEILGILFDNAIEASMTNPKNREIYFEMSKCNTEYRFLVMNVYSIVKYEEMKQWFELGKSKKGNDRGLGLYRAKELCLEWGCDILCRNQYKDNVNWIQFELVMKDKKDGE